jgi:hypothetical protein
MPEFVYDLNDILELKKPHPCASKSTKWKVVRMGADIKIECLGCGNKVMLTRFDLNTRIKKVLKEDK